MANIQKEGTIAVWLTINEGQWPETGDAKLPPLQAEHVNLSVSAKEHKLIVKVSGIFSREFTFRCELPELKPVPRSPDQMGFMVAVSCKRPKVTVYVNGEKIGDSKLKLH